MPCIWSLSQLLLLINIKSPEQQGGKIYPTTLVHIQMHLYMHELSVGQLEHCRHVALVTSTSLVPETKILTKDTSL